MKTKIVEYIGRIQDGGAETLIKDYALMLNKENYEVIVLCDFSKNNSSIYKTLQDNNVKVIELFGKHHVFFRGLVRLFGRRVTAFLLEKELKRIKPDVLHVHLESLETVYYARNCLKNVRLFYTCHNLPKTMIGEDFPNEEKAAKYLIDNYNLRMIALHDDMAKEINQRFSISNTCVIKNGIDFSKYRDINKTKEELKKEYGVPVNSYVVGSVGRLTYQKNPEFIVDVFNEILKINKNAFLIMVGSGRMKKDVIKRVNNYNIGQNVMMLSHRDDMPQIYKMMDVFLFPSRYEGLGIVLIEAQVSGVHCVISDAVPIEAHQSNQITVLSLKDSAQEWAANCLERKTNLEQYGNIAEYDMNLEIEKLKDLYDGRI